MKTIHFLIYKNINIDEVNMNPQLFKIKKSHIRDFHEKVKKTENVLDFTLGDSNDHVNDEIKEAAIQSLENNETHYSESQGLYELRDMLRLKEMYYDVQEICITSGATQGLFEVMMALLKKGDGLLIGIPAYPSYISLCTLFELDLQIFVFDDEFQISESSIRAVIQENTKAILINHPHNPSGSALDRKSIQTLHRLCKEYDLLLIWDATYFECSSYLSLYCLSLHEKIIQIHSFSKSSLMCGFRIGYVCVPQNKIDEIIKVHQLIQSCLPVFTQKSALEALHHPSMNYDEQKTYIIQRLQNMGVKVVKTQGPYYVFFSIEDFHISSEVFADRLLEEVHVAVLPGKYFYYENHIRMSCCIDLVKCKEGCDRLEAFVRRL